ncbi:hypothetical protein BD769DRAFT_1673822 [Suillus cothurnatus]|nr:hypothetical protein BD769DRAFT_1673822 [Suillus cothurnatus]
MRKRTKARALDVTRCSLQRIAGAAQSDHCKFNSSYVISRQEVDQFKNEVQHHQHIDCDKESDDKDEDVDEMLASCLTWKSSAPDHKKTATDIYETTGIFASACHHGFIIKFGEMVRSGELVKYPHAIMNTMIDAYGKDIGMGYDVGCTFSGIVHKSPLLNQKAEEARMQFCVNSFHGYAHNRLCQVQHHPLYLPGFGLEDLKTMDELSKFLLNNYMQAIGIIKKYEDEVSSLASSLNIHEEDFERWIEEEC